MYFYMPWMADHTSTLTLRISSHRVQGEASLHLVSKHGSVRCFDRSLYVHVHVVMAITLCASVMLSTRLPSPPTRQVLLSNTRRDMLRRPRTQLHVPNTCTSPVLDGERRVKMQVPRHRLDCRICLSWRVALANLSPRYSPLCHWEREREG